MVFFIFFCVAVGYTFYNIEPEEYKEEILSRIHQNTGLSINFTHNRIFFFPYPGIELEKLEVYNEDTLVATLEKLNLEIDIIRIILGEVSIQSVGLDTGKINLTRLRTGDIELVEEIMGRISDSSQKNLPSDPIENSSPSEIRPEWFYEYFPKTITIKNVEIDYIDKYYNKSYHLFMEKNNFRISAFSRSIYWELIGVLNGREIKIFNDFYWKYNEFSYESFRTKGSFQLDHFSLSIIDDMMVIFGDGDFKTTTISGMLNISKTEDDETILKVDSLLVKNLRKKYEKPMGSILVSTDMSYSLKKHKLGFERIKILSKNRAELFGWGYLTFTQSPIIYFQVKSSYIDVHSTLDVVSLWLDPDLNQSIFLKGLPDTGYKNRYKLILDFDLKNVFVYDEKLDSVKTKIVYSKPSIRIPHLSIEAYRGSLDGKGSVQIFQNPPKFQFEGNIKNIHLEEAMNRIGMKKYVTGTISSTFLLEAEGVSEKSVFDSLKIDGKILMEEGELIGYLNFLKPIASLGKILNLTGPQGRSLGYESINTDFNYKNKIFHFYNMKMKGVGLDAEGSGNIHLNGQIDFRILIALSGIAGKVVKLPIIYRGFFGKNLPYVDPVWLGSVYAGTLFLAGPAGATVGGIAGSAASDYINQAYTSFKNLFRKKEKTSE